MPLSDISRDNPIIVENTFLTLLLISENININIIKVKQSMKA